MLHRILCVFALTLLAACGTAEIETIPLPTAPTSELTQSVTAESDEIGTLTISHPEGWLVDNQEVGLLSLVNAEELVDSDEPPREGQLRVNAAGIPVQGVSESVDQTFSDLPFLAEMTVDDALFSYIEQILIEPELQTDIRKDVQLFDAGGRPGAYASLTIPNSAGRLIAAVKVERGFIFLTLLAAPGTAEQHLPLFQAFAAEAQYTVPDA